MLLEALQGGLGLFREKKRAKGCDMFTLGEIIDLAIRIEKNGEKAYRKGREEVSDPSLASLLQWLADEEAEHEKWFYQLKDLAGTAQTDPRLDEMARAVLGGVLGERAFSIEEADFSKIEDVNHLLELSMEFERDTILFYQMLSAFLEEEKVLEQIHKIIEEENHHVLVLEDLLQKRNGNSFL